MLLLALKARGILRAKSLLGDKKASCSHLYITFYCFSFSVLYVVYTITLSQRHPPLLLSWLLPFSTSQNLSYCGIGRCQKLSSPDWGLKGVVVVTICQQLTRFPNLTWKVVSWDHFLGPLLGWVLSETNAKTGMCRWYIWKTRKSWCRVRGTQTGSGMQTARYSNIQLLWWLIDLYPIRRNSETSSFKHLYPMEGICLLSHSTPVFSLESLGSSVDVVTLLNAMCLEKTDLDGQRRLSYVRNWIDIC